MVMRQGRTDSSHTERSFAYGSLANRSHSRRAGWGTESRVRDLPKGSEFAGQISLARTYPRGCARRYFRGGGTCAMREKQKAL